MQHGKVRPRKCLECGAAGGHACRKRFCEEQRSNTATSIRNGNSEFDADDSCYEKAEAQAS